MEQQLMRPEDFIVEGGCGFYLNLSTLEPVSFDALAKVFDRDQLLQIPLGRRPRLRDRRGSQKLPRLRDRRGSQKLPLEA
jgi:hypothetical protein